jgi:hypothetical protein
MIGSLSGIGASVGLTVVAGGEKGGDRGGCGTGRMSTDTDWCGFAPPSTSLKLSRGTGSGGDMRLLISHVFFESAATEGVLGSAREGCISFVGVGGRLGFEDVPQK